MKAKALDFLDTDIKAPAAFPYHPNVFFKMALELAETGKYFVGNEFLSRNLFKLGSFTKIDLNWEFLANVVKRHSDLNTQKERSGKDWLDILSEKELVEFGEIQFSATKALYMGFTSYIMNMTSVGVYHSLHLNLFSY